MRGTGQLAVEWAEHPGGLAGPERLGQRWHVEELIIVQPVQRNEASETLVR
jgi:hypothetical protein